MLRSHPHVVERSELARLLLIEFAANSGDLQTVRALMTGFVVHDHHEFHALFELATARIGRADALAIVGQQGIADLRWWEAVLNGSLLLHLADVGDDDMQGRYAVLWDQPAGVASIVDRFVKLLSQVGRTPNRVVTDDDRHSQVLGAVLARRLGLSSPGSYHAAPHPAAGGIVVVVCYNWAEASADLVDRYGNDPDAVMFAYHLDGERSYRLAPDVIGIEAQVVTPAWGEPMRLLGPPDDHFRPGPVMVQADTRPPEAVAADLIEAEPDTERSDDDRSLALFVDAVTSHPHLWGLMGGPRRAFRPGPLRSSRVE